MKTLSNFGIDFNTFSKFISQCFYEKSPKRDYAFLSGSMDKDEFIEYQDDESDKYNETLLDIYDYIMNFNPLYGDMSAKNSWGIQKDEDGDDKLVFLYYGMNERVYNNYENNRKQHHRY